MKIRHKHGYSDYLEVIEESASYYIVRSEEVKPKSYWEPIPTETWRDVSSECEWDGNNCLVHRNGGRFGDEIVTAEKGYRLRKVTLAVHDQQAPLGVNPVDAFIIEKRTN